MADVFFSYVEEDGDATRAISEALEQAGYSTWFYERDSHPGPTYLGQVARAIEESQVVLVIISPQSVQSEQVDREIVHAHESGKHFMPVLRGLSHQEFQTRRPEWRMAIGASTSIVLVPERATEAYARIISGLRMFGIRPEDSTPPSVPPTVGPNGPGGQTVDPAEATRSASTSSLPDRRPERSGPRPLRRRPLHRGAGAPARASSSVPPTGGSDGAGARSVEWSDRSRQTDEARSVAHLVGTDLNSYHLEELLGQGAMGTVFKAYHRSLNRYVALKILDQALMSIPEFRQRFEQEAQLAARLDHPNIVAIYDFGQAEGRQYITMRLVEGPTLEQILARDGRLDAGRALHLVGQVADALEYAHRAGVLHRDVKPGNILVTADGRPLLTDFGLARIAAGLQLTQANSMIGTPRYMSPEQALGERLDARSDIYSLGVVLYELLAGSPPFQADSTPAMLFKHAYEAPRPLSEVRPDLPPAVQELVAKCLAKPRDARFQTGGELATACLALAGVRSPDGSGSLSASGAAAVSPPAPVEAAGASVPVPSNGGAAWPLAPVPTGSGSAGPAGERAGSQVLEQPGASTGVGRAGADGPSPRPPARNRRLLAMSLVGVIAVIALVSILLVQPFGEPAESPVAARPAQPAANAKVAAPQPASAPVGAAAQGVAKPAAAAANPAVAAPQQLSIPAAVPPLSTARRLHTATLLPGGKILVAGGRQDAEPIADAELYDPATNSWSAAGAMGVPRFGHSATALADGRVLVVGGQSSDTAYLDSAEIYDPATNTWSAAGKLADPRADHSATLLADGRVLVAGGNNLGNVLRSAAVFAPASNDWAPSGQLAGGHSGHAAALLRDGRVIVVGGFGTTSQATVELYDPGSNTWGAGAPMPVGRVGQTATVLPDGRVLVAGGLNSTGGGTYLSTVHVYDPGANAWAEAAPMAGPRAEHSAVLLGNGQVLVVAGKGSAPEPLASAERYDPAANSWSGAGTLSAGRWQHAALPLSGADVLVVGGLAEQGPVADAELYSIIRDRWSPSLRPVRRLALTLSSQNDSNIGGTATLTDLGNGLTRVEFDATGAGSGPRPAHIHEGSCARLNPEPRLNLTPVIDGKSTTEVEVPIREILTIPMAIHMHKSPQEMTIHVACADIVLTPAAAAAPPVSSLALTLTSQNDSNIGGTAMLTDLGGGRTRVEFDVTGAGSGPRPAHIHEGSCARLDPEPRLNLTPVVNGKSTTEVEVPIREILTIPMAIHMHKSPQEMTIHVACADIVLTPIGEEAPPVNKLSLPLASRDGSNVGGTATLTDLGNGKTRVELALTGAGSGPQPAHIHDGNCTLPNAKPRVPLTSVVDGKSVTEVDEPLAEILSQPSVVLVHKSEREMSAIVGCAAISAPD